MPKVMKDKEAMQKRGNILYDLRKQKGIKQSTIADILGVSQQAYLKYEHGDADPTIDALIKLSDFYKVSIEYLLGIDTKPPVNPLDMLAIDTGSKNVMEMFAALPEDTRKIILDAMVKLTHAAEKTADQTSEQTTTFTTTCGELEDRAAEREKGGRFA